MIDKLDALHSETSEWVRRASLKEITLLLEDIRAELIDRGNPIAGALVAGAAEALWAPRQSGEVGSPLVEDEPLLP
jgi:hypothetical protein